MIEIESLTRLYGPLAAVDKVSFSVRKGEIVSLLGHNGAGKSTIMKMLTGYLEPTSGTIHVSGMEIGEKTRTIQKKIGYLPENCPLWPEMTVIDYLVYQGSLRGVPSDKLDSAVARAISRTTLKKKATERIETLSRGYRQRVGVAQAILHDPEIIILDEPTNGLDPTQVRSMRSLIKELAEHATLIISTHILQEVRAVCERVLIMRSGKLVLDLDLKEIESDTKCTFKLTTDRDFSEMLRKLEGISMVQITDRKDSRIIHQFDADRDFIPSVTKAVHEDGALLYGLEAQQRDLEAIFAEVNEENSHAA
ncbi:MAG: ATP-binding cassette domain-containing protein [Alphaproteobacteria bacterium]|nr:ATP-binding cassette domain-containing protein [Alphaproteobacteria bacterium]